MGLFDWLTGGGEDPSREEATGDPDDPLRVAVDSVLSIGGPAIVTGRVESGTVTPGDSVRIAGSEARVRTVERHHEAVERATPGDHVGLELEGVTTGEVRGADSLRGA